MTERKDYYKILEVDKNASTDQIKKQYRVLAMKNHPDKGGDPEKFKDVAEAYEVLSNPDKRGQYDNPQQAFHFNQGQINPEEIFKAFFGGGGGPPGFGVQFGMHPGMHPQVHIQSPFSNVHVVNIGSRQNVTSRATNVHTQGNKRIERTTEVKNGIKTEIIRETNLETGEVRQGIRQLR
jgi:DnaJ-class molecular chaperone